MNAKLVYCSKYNSIKSNKSPNFCQVSLKPTNSSTTAVLKENIVRCECLYAALQSSNMSAKIAKHFIYHIQFM